MSEGCAGSVGMWTRTWHCASSSSVRPLASGPKTRARRPPPARAPASRGQPPRRPGLRHGRGPRCPRRASAPGDGLAQRGPGHGGVEHVPGAVGERPRLGLVEARGRLRRGQGARGPCSSWRGRPRRRWPARAGPHEHDVDAAEVHGRASLTFILTREWPASPRVSSFDESLPAASPRAVARPVRPRRPGLAGADGPPLPLDPGLHDQPRQRPVALRIRPRSGGASTRAATRSASWSARPCPPRDGYEIQEDGRLQMTLLGATSAARLHTAVQVDKAFEVRSFQFSMDPGTGAIEIEGHAWTGGACSSRSRRPAARARRRGSSPERPALSLNLLAAAGRGGPRAGQARRGLRVRPGDPAQRDDGRRRAGARGRAGGAAGPSPPSASARRFAGITSTSWVTDMGEVVREESPLGLIVVKETPGARHRAGRARPRCRCDMLETAAIVPSAAPRIDDPATVEQLRRPAGGRGPRPARTSQGGGQTVTGDVVEVRDAETLKAGAGRAGPRPLASARALPRERRAGDRGRGEEGGRRRRPSPACAPSA